MKIIHTADWHIGKRLHNVELEKDFELFIDWLITIIKQEKVELVLVSGDIFDLSNPSSTSRKQFYSALIRLQQLNCKVIITGGNHDSPSMLNAPKEILNAININVIGGLPEYFEDYILPIKNQNGEVELVIHAIPFLRDSDLRKANDGITYEDRLKAVQDGIQYTYENAINYGKKHFPTAAHLAMGHLFTAGVSTSDSEREIQVGNEAKFEVNRLGNDFNYIALGHIHKPQRLNAVVPAFYSGSPLPLSFSERKDEKRILMLDTTKGFEPKSIPVPNFRKLLRISGDLGEVKQKIHQFKAEAQLKTLIEVELIEEKYNTEKEDEFLQYINAFEHENAEIVKTRMTFHDRVLGAHELFKDSDDITDLKPIEMFNKLLDTQELTDEFKKELQQAFHQLLEEILSE